MRIPQTQQCKNKPCVEIDNVAESFMTRISDELRLMSHGECSFMEKCPVGNFVELRITMWQKSARLITCYDSGHNKLRGKPASDASFSSPSTSDFFRWVHDLQRVMNLYLTPFSFAFQKGFLNEFHAFSKRGPNPHGHAALICGIHLEERPSQSAALEMQYCGQRMTSLLSPNSFQELDLLDIVTSFGLVHSRRDFSWISKTGTTSGFQVRVKRITRSQSAFVEFKLDKARPSKGYEFDVTFRDIGTDVSFFTHCCQHFVLSRSHEKCFVMVFALFLPAHAKEQQSEKEFISPEDDWFARQKSRSLAQYKSACASLSFHRNTNVFSLQSWSYPERKTQKGYESALLKTKNNGFVCNQSPLVHCHFCSKFMWDTPHTHTHGVLSLSLLPFYPHAIRVRSRR